MTFLTTILFYLGTLLTIFRRHCKDLNASPLALTVYEVYQIR